jgi:effector-binding domain-containing protein
MKKKWIVIVVIMGIILIGVALSGPIMSNIETPGYEVVSSEQNIEIRLYQPMVIAEAEVTGNREESISNGFRLLADYIFGNNTVQQDIAMTAPVQQEHISQKIAMTAPVQQQSSGDSWKVSFVMPVEYTIESLPKPNNKHVVLRQTPQKQFAVIRFSGTSSDENVKKHEKELINYLNAKGIQVTGSPKYAFYNPPWTLPFMRRNEVMIEIKQ